MGLCFGESLRTRGSQVIPRALDTALSVPLGLGLGATIVCQLPKPES